MRHIVVLYTTLYSMLRIAQTMIKVNPVRAVGLLILNQLGLRLGAMRPYLLELYGSIGTNPAKLAILRM